MEHPPTQCLSTWHVTRKVVQLVNSLRVHLKPRVQPERHELAAVGKQSHRKLARSASKEINRSVSAQVERPQRRTSDRITRIRRSGSGCSWQDWPTIQNHEKQTNDARRCVDRLVQDADRYLSSTKFSLGRVAANDGLFISRKTSLSFESLTWPEVVRLVALIDDALAVVNLLRPSSSTVVDYGRLLCQGKEIGYQHSFDHMFLANLEHLLLRLRDSLFKMLIRKISETLQKDAVHWRNHWHCQRKLGGDNNWCSDIRPSLAVLWGVCWMYYEDNREDIGYRPPDDLGFGLPQLLDMWRQPGSDSYAEYGQALAPQLLTPSGDRRRVSLTVRPNATAQPHLQCQALMSHDPIHAAALGSSRDQSTYPGNTTYLVPSHADLYSSDANLSRSHADRESPTSPSAADWAAASGINTAFAHQDYFQPTHTWLQQIRTQDDLPQRQQHHLIPGVAVTRPTPVISDAAPPYEDDDNSAPSISCDASRDVQGINTTSELPLNFDARSYYRNRQWIPSRQSTLEPNNTMCPARILTRDRSSSPNRPRSVEAETADAEATSPEDTTGFSPGRGHTFRRPDPPRTEENKIRCEYRECAHLIFDRKCEWSKHMDKHDRPYKCKESGCEKLQGFTYSGGLLRHQREVHKLFGGTKKALFCHIAGCKRASGTGFTRKENLAEHIRRVHQRTSTDSASTGDRREDDVEDDCENDVADSPQPAERSPTDTRRDSVHAKRRRAVDPSDEGGGEDDPREEIKRLRREVADKDERLKRVEATLSELLKRTQPLLRSLNSIL